MTEQPPETDHVAETEHIIEGVLDEPESTDVPGEPTSTGHPAVDEVLRSLDALDEAPVDGHVAVFEQAHEQLRRTLSGAGDDQT